MYTKAAMRELGAGPDQLTTSQRDELDANGFFVVPDVLSAADCAIMRDEFERIHASERDQGGKEVHVEPGARRISNIFNKTTAFDPCLWIPEVLAASSYLLGEIKVHGANLRDPVQGFGNQDLHSDVPKKFPDDWWVVNSMIMFDDMTLQNGPTRVVPRSHLWTPINVPNVNIGDWEPAPLSPEDNQRLPADLGAPYPGEILVEASAGSAIICWRQAEAANCERCSLTSTGCNASSTRPISTPSSPTPPASLETRRCSCCTDRKSTRLNSSHG